MSGFRGQERLRVDIRPIIADVMDFSEPTDGTLALHGLDADSTLFHEFGHALHGLLSDVTYLCLAGTSVDRDFVELGSQVFEHWLGAPEVLERFAGHHGTGEPMPASLVQWLQAARNADQGFATVEYTACALVDLDLHLWPEADDLDFGAYEATSLARIGMPDPVVMRYRPPRFAHLFSGGGYASGDYSYMWSEVLDAGDGFRAFEYTGDPFESALARRLKDHV